MGSHIECFLCSVICHRSQWSRSPYPLLIQNTFLQLKKWRVGSSNTRYFLKKTGKYFFSPKNLAMIVWFEVVKVPYSLSIPFLSHCKSDDPPWKIDQLAIPFVKISYIVLGRRFRHLWRNYTSLYKSSMNWLLDSWFLKSYELVLGYLIPYMFYIAYFFWIQELCKNLEI